MSMSKHAATLVLVGASVVGFACSSSEADKSGTSDDATNGDGESEKSKAQPITACNMPAGLPSPSSDLTRGACTPRPGFQGCVVPNGSVVEPDGTIKTPDGETASCKALCAPTDFALTCLSSSPTDAISPTPDPSLGCTPIVVPTPLGTTFYCCPCAN